jgi:hypothetical protein
MSPAIDMAIGAMPWIGSGLPPLINIDEADSFQRQHCSRFSSIESIDIRCASDELNRHFQQANEMDSLILVHSVTRM